MLARTWSLARDAITRGRQECRTQSRDIQPARALRHPLSLVAHWTVFVYWLVCLRPGIDQVGLELGILLSVGISGMHHHIWLKWGDFT